MIWQGRSASRPATTWAKGIPASSCLASKRDGAPPKRGAAEREQSEVLLDQSGKAEAKAMEEAPSLYAPSNV